MSFRSGLALLGILLMSGPMAQAQLVVLVRSSGAPVPNVELTVWHANERVAGGHTDGFGLATLRIARSVDAEAAVTARRLGYVQRRVPIMGQDTVRIDLEAVGTTLPVLAVRSHALRCPVGNDAAAARLVERAGERYGRGQAALYFGFLGRWVQEDVTPEFRGFGSGEGGQKRMGMFTPTAGGRSVKPRPPPYAEYYQDQWHYADLEGLSAWHFTSEPFRVRHDFVVLDSSHGATVVGFCPRTHGEPEIEGELAIGSDSLFEAARWTFLVPRDGDDAGGEVSFAIGHYLRTPFLVAVRGSFWRRSGRSRYAQRSFELDSWRFGRSVAEVQTGWQPLGDVNR
jgi:hypothetical protein